MPLLYRSCPFQEMHIKITLLHEMIAFELSYHVILCCRRRVLKISDDVGSLGQIQWELVLYLLLAWILTFIFLCKGIKSSGKVY